MTAKDKAKELVDKMAYGNSYDEHHNSSLYTAKQCALIAVEEMIYYLPSVDIYPYFAQKITPRVKEYWQEVKQEIDKL